MCGVLLAPPYNLFKKAKDKGERFPFQITSHLFFLAPRQLSQ